MEYICAIGCLNSVVSETISVSKQNRFNDANVGSFSKSVLRNRFFARALSVSQNN